MKKETTLKHQFLRTCSDIPAFYVGFLLVSFILAALTNFGASLLFLAAALTVSWARDVKRNVHHPFASSLRYHLPDILILLTGVTSAIFLHPSSGLIAGRGLGRAGFAVFRGTVSITSKMFVLLRFVSTAVWQTEEHERRFSVVEVFFLLSLALVIALLALAPFVVSGGTTAVLQIFRTQIIPWRM